MAGDRHIEVKWTHGFMEQRSNAGIKTLLR